MAVEGISGAGMSYQGSSSTVEIKEESRAKTESASNEVVSDKIAKDTVSISTKETDTDSKDNSSNKNLNQQMEKNSQIRKAVEEINKSAAGSQSEAIFGIHEETNRVTIKIVDKKSKEVIKEYPAEKTLDMIAKVWEMAGIMVDEKR